MESNTTYASQAPLAEERDAAQRAAMSQHVISCSHVSKVFKDFWLRSRVRAVDDVNLDVRQGEVFGLLGPNGSGKSTTIKMILGLLHPTAGRIAVLGKRPDDVSVKKQIGYLPEDSYLYRFLNARETLDYYGRLFYQSGLQRQRRIDMLLEMVGLDAVQRRPVGEYSKGMQRRIGLAQALINDPDLLILDEPTTGMDPLGTRQIKDIILSLKKRGKTIVLCSHLLADVEDVCDRVSIMFGGKVIEQGNLQNLLTVSDITTIESQTLDEQTIAEIEQVLERRGHHIEQVRHPRQSLEKLVLDLVKREQDRGTATAGAHARGRVAAFLRTDGEGEGDTHESQAAQSEQVLEDLTRPQDAPAAQAGAPAAPSANASEAPQDDKAPQLDASVLEGLTNAQSQTPPRASGATSDAPTQAGTEAGTSEERDAPTEQYDQDVLDSLTRDDSRRD